MDENLDAGRLNRQVLHLWLAISLRPRRLSRGLGGAALRAGSRALSLAVPAAARRPEVPAAGMASLAESLRQPHG